MLVVAGLGFVIVWYKKNDNDDQNVVSVVNDVGENVRVVSVAAVAVGEGGKSKKNR